MPMKTIVAMAKISSVPHKDFNLEFCKCFLLQIIQLKATADNSFSCKTLQVWKGTPYYS